MRVVNLLYFFFLISISTHVFAVNPESSRILVHTLNYLGHDYKHAVANGKVISEDEYHEMMEFSESAEKYFREFSTEWSDADSVQVGELLEELLTCVKDKANPDIVAAKSAVIKTKVIAITGLKTHPFRYPDIANGKKLFLAECAKCHGEKGLGNGLEGKDLSPEPRNFHEEERIKTISPSHAFNTIRLGVEGTGMRAHPGFEDDEVWDIAFYVLSLRYEGKPVSPSTNSDIPLEKIAMKSDDELTKEFSLSSGQLAALRLQQPVVSNDRFLYTAGEYLEKVIQSYNHSDNVQALKYASLAYLEGVEPVELHIKASDPELSERIEKQFLQIRKMINEKRSEEELADSVTAAKLSIREAQNLLEKKEYSFWLALFMSLSILLREGLEAFLVILVMLSVLKAANQTKAAKWVHSGWIAAVLVGVALWCASSLFITEGLGSIEIIEGSISFLAVAMLLYIGFWLHGKSEISKWKEFVSTQINTVMNNGSLLGLASLSFFVVFREAFESVLFLSALNIESGGKQASGILAGVLLAFAVVMVFAFFVLKFSAKLPIPKLFKISSLVMGLLAVVLVGKGIHSFQEISYIPVHGIPFIRVELLGIFPTLETTVGQTLIVVILLFLNRKNG